MHTTTQRTQICKMEMMFSRWRFDFRYFFLSTFSSPSDGRCGVPCAQRSPRPGKNVYLHLYWCAFVWILFVAILVCTLRSRNFHLKQERIESNVERQINVYKCFTKRKAAKPNTAFFLFFCSEWVLAYSHRSIRPHGERRWRRRRRRPEQ